MRLPRALAAGALLLALTPAPARADATAFVGSTVTPSNRLAKGLAIGAGLLIIGFEFEYASTGEDVGESAPGLRTGMGNVLVQTPVAIAGIRPYATAGAGGFRERLGSGQETNVGTNVGGGVKISLIGPVRARLDYRLFKLRGDVLHSTVHRVYAGLNIGF